MPPNSFSSGRPPTKKTLLPEHLALAACLNALLGKQLKVSRTAPLVFNRQALPPLAVYENDSGAVVALCAFELGLASKLGAALALIPPQQAAECEQVGQLSGNIAENLGEVANIMARLLNAAGAPHVKLHEVLLPPWPVPEGMAKALAAPAQRLDLELSVPGYGAGKLTLLLV